MVANGNISKPRHFFCHVTLSFGIYPLHSSRYKVIDGLIKPAEEEALLALLLLLVVLDVGEGHAVGGFPAT